MKTFLSYEEDQAYHEGQSDAKRGRRDHERVSLMFADLDSPDRAYWEGFNDYQKERERQRQRDEEYDGWRNEE